MTARTSRRSESLRVILGCLWLGALPAVGALGAIDTQVAEAARRGEIDEVQSLLRQGGDVNSAPGDGLTALHWAALHGDAAMARMLTWAGANLEATTRLGGYTPLLLASREGHAAAIEVLLESGAEPELASSTGATPLMLAAQSGDPASVAVLLEHGANPNARDTARGQTPLMFAAAANQAVLIGELVQNGADPALVSDVFDMVELDERSREERTRKRERRKAEEELAKAAEKRAKEKAEKQAKEESSSDESVQIAEAGKAPSAGEESARELKAEEGGAEVEGAAERGKKKRRKKKKEEAEPEVEAAEPLSFAQLVDKRGGLSALHYAAREGHRQAVRELLDAGAPIDQPSAGDHTTPLLIATINGHFDLALDLLERGADPGIASSAGATPLYAAINVQWAPHAFYPQPSVEHEEASYLDLMRELLEHGACPNVRLERKLWYTGYNFDQSGVDETGATPFWRAAQSADVAAMRLLIEHGADPTIPTLIVPERRLPNGRNFDADLEATAPEIGGPAVTPLQAATGAGYNANFHRIAPGGFMASTRYLVEELGLSVKGADYHGYTPVHYAASRGDNEMIIYLLFRGADPLAVSRYGETTVDMANGPVQRIQPFPETIALLESFGATNNNNCVSC